MSQSPYIVALGGNPHIPAKMKSTNGMLICICIVTIFLVSVVGQVNPAVYMVIIGAFIATAYIMKTHEYKYRSAKDKRFYQVVMPKYADTSNIAPEQIMQLVRENRKHYAPELATTVDKHYNDAVTEYNNTE